MGAKITVGEYLLLRLHEIGVRHIFGVPGDFNLPFLEQILTFDGLEWVGNCNELNAAYAADGYARVNGVSALLVTYGVGDLSALNGVAGANAEHVPLVCISGLPPLRSIKNREILHHTSGTGDFEDVMTCMSQFTAAKARITPANAAVEIDRLLLTCMREKRPVYLQLPCDVVFLMVEAPSGALEQYAVGVDEQQVELVADLISRKMSAARRPALLVDVDAHRFHLRSSILSLLECCSIPFASMASGRGTLDEQHPLYCGIYAGASSAEQTRATIEGSDCLLMVGVRFFDATTSFFHTNLRVENSILLEPFSARIADRVYEGVTAAAVLKSLRHKFDCMCREQGKAAMESEAAAIAPVYTVEGFGGSRKLTHQRLWPRIAGFLRKRDLIVSEVGCAQAGMSMIRLPADTVYLNQTTWASIGYSLPAFLGASIAAPSRRQMLFIGDGSLQVTAQELSTMLRQNLDPIIFVINNNGYTIERMILGPQSAYNDIQPWRYADLPGIFAGGKAVRSYKASTEGELADVLNKVEAERAFTIVELVLDELDAPPGLSKMGPEAAEYNFGERGPQRSGASIAGKSAGDRIL